ncbi:MAG: hypothetical protein E4H14_12670 [Candidatus Thorarchaeota archaeon]|nr:MAG: hypothetical protein E4H14_12670 [Candidatus Thorarchaeota archaeon]
MNETADRSKWAKWVIIITTLLAPSGVYFFSLQNENITVSVHAILWSIMPEHSGLSEIVIIVMRLSYGIFNIWFGIAVIRTFEDYTRKRTAIIAGVFSMAYPLVLAIISWPWIIQSESLVYMGPIPIQLIIGLLIMKYFGEPEIHEPWSD